MEILKIGHVDCKHQKSYYLYSLSMKNIHSHHIFLQFPIPLILYETNTQQIRLWNIFSNIVSNIFFHFLCWKNHWKNSPQLHSIRAWSPFDKGPALSITTLRCLRGAVMRPRRGRSHSRAWPGGGARDTWIILLEGSRG